jgi:hypothetical protein
MLADTRLQTFPKWQVYVGMGGRIQRNTHNACCSPMRPCQKRTLLLSEHFTEEVFLELPHSQFVFTVLKVLRLIFRRNRTLFAKVSRLINQLISDFYQYATGRIIRFGMIAAHQTFDDNRCVPQHYMLM